MTDHEQGIPGPAPERPQCANCPHATHRGPCPTKHRSGPPQARTTTPCTCGHQADQ